MIRSPVPDSPRAASRRVRRLACVVGCALASVCVALGCGWSGPVDSVRFSGWGEPNERAYSRLPPLSVDGSTPAARADEGEGETYEEAERRAAALDELCAQATDPSAVADVAAAEKVRQNLRACLAGLEDQDERNTALDLLDAFTALDSGSTPSAVRAYAKARELYDLSFTNARRTGVSGHRPAPTPGADSEAEAERAARDEELRRALAEAGADRNLADNAAYLRAAVLYREAKYAEAARAFAAVVSRSPRSEKREASLLMSGLAHLKQSRAYVAGDTTANSSDPCPDCRDAAWASARSDFRRLLDGHPRGRFRTDARGWLAFLSLRVGDTGAGLAEYYRLLADESDDSARAAALVWLRMTRDGADDSEMRRVEQELAGEPRAALAYAYHSLYNFAPALASWYLPPPERAEQERDDEDSNDDYDASRSVRHYNGRKTESRVQSARSRELKRVADFAEAMLRRHPRAQVGGEFALRLAEAKFESDEPPAALAFAARALGAGLAGERRAEALWVKGAAEYRLRRFADARRSLLALVAESPRSRLAPGARRLAAMVAEDAGDLAGALEQYLALQYREDAAYILDVLMTPDQLAAFVERQPDTPARDELLYALGVRYLRAGRYAEARAAYARVRTSQQADHAWDWGVACDPASGGEYETIRCRDPKDVPAYPRPEPGVRERWVLRDLQTADALERFDCRFESAADDESKAEALYQKASYIFESDLLFYNPAAWRGERFELMAALDQSHLYRAPGEADTLFRYAGRHDMAARALELYLEVVERFPDTRAARDALYTAAVCHARLAEYNNYWRERYSSGLHAGSRLVTYADVLAAYPDYRFPSGTFGWEPSTRTVNGRAAWPAPPKPKARPTRAERVKALALAHWPSAVYFAGRAWHWLTVALVLAGCVLSWRVARRERVRWRTALARSGAETKAAAETLRELRVAAGDALRAAGVWRPRASSGRGGSAGGDGPASPAAAPAPPWMLYEPQQTWLELRVHKYFHAAELISRATARALWHYVSPLTHDTRGRQTLTANAIAHALLFALLTTFVRLLYAG